MKNNVNKEQLVEEYQQLQLDKRNAMSIHERYKKEAYKYFNLYEQYLAISQNNQEKTIKIEKEMETIVLQLEELGVYEYEL